MTPEHNTYDRPSVSVVITSYNHAKYLPEAILSVQQQTYHPIEVVVVDDGSTDNTKEVIAQFTGVNYIYQQNQGLSAARNTGIVHSSGQYILFLDADDWLYKEGVAINVAYFEKHPEAAFVSGAHDKVNNEGKVIEEVMEDVTKDHYLHLLQGNYIGMHAAVMYKKSILERFKFDSALKVCEDYDLYLRVAREFPVVHHTQKIATYRIHGSNMSSNEQLMLDGVLHVLERQKKELRTKEEIQASKAGRKIWKEYYLERIRENDGYSKRVKQQALWKYDKDSYVRQTINNKKTLIKEAIKKITPEFLLHLVRKKDVNAIPEPGKVNAGDLGRLNPFSIEFGYDGGGPVDRYYIENFLERQSAIIKGRVLEIGDNSYTMQFGGSKVTKSDILHVDDENPNATIIGDLSNAPTIPSDSFDCIILTQTLHLVYDYQAALRTCYRILKPGGVLLFTVPGITPIDHDKWKFTWYWSFTSHSVKKFTGEIFPGWNIEVESFGNVFVATAFLYGMGLPEVSRDKMDYHDDHYQLIITAKCIKP